MWVRTASEADLPAVHALLAETMQAAYGKILGPISVAGIVSSMHAIDVMRAWLNSPFSEFVVADDGNGSVDGMAFARQLTDDTVRLSHLYVRPSEQVQGLGTTLLADAAGGSGVGLSRRPLHDAGCDQGPVRRRALLRAERVCGDRRGMRVEGRELREAHRFHAKNTGNLGVLAVDVQALAAAPSPMCYLPSGLRRHKHSVQRSVGSRYVNGSG